MGELHSNGNGEEVGRGCIVMRGEGVHSDGEEDGGTA